MKNNANLFIAVLIVIGFIFVWDAFVVSRFGPARPKTAAVATPTPTPSTSVSLSAASKQDAKPSNASAAPIVPASLEQNGTRVELESFGARVTSWRIRERDHWIELVYRGETPSLPLELFPDLAYGLESSDSRRAVYTATHPNGFLIRKTLSLSPTSYFHDFAVEVINTGSRSVEIDASVGWGPGLNKREIESTGEAKEGDAFAEMRAVALADHLREWKPGFIFGRTVNVTNAGPFHWVGVDNHHFLAALTPPEGTVSDVHVRADRKNAPMVSIPNKLKLGAGEKKQIAYKLYVGPKHGPELREAGHGLEKAISFGFFGVISKGLLNALEYFRRITGNYGWAICIVTVLIQILVFPLTKKSLDHSVKMRELQPQLKKLQEQFKSDPKRLQVETMNLYKKQGMHFLGLEGCLPILLQIPIFFAFYSALNGAYELRGAPWILWINDLAAPDRFYVLPILMAAGMFLQQKLTTVPTDPAQAKMMMIMPVLFLFMFLKMPAGLVLYWTLNSLCTILSQRILLLKKAPTAPSS